MTTSSQQIGQSQEAKLLYEISKQLERVIQIVGSNTNPSTTTTTTTV